MVVQYYKMGQNGKLGQTNFAAHSEKNQRQQTTYIA
jgi:hypothetical protein